MSKIVGQRYAGTVKSRQRAADKTLEIQSKLSINRDVNQFQFQSLEIIIGDRRGMKRALTGEWMEELSLPDVLYLVRVTITSVKIEI